MEVIVKLGQLAGVAGISLGILLLIFRQIIAKKIFPQLSQLHSFKLLRLIITFLFTIGLIGMILWTLNPIILQEFNHTKAQNPFGDEEILLNEKKLFFSRSNFEESGGDEFIKIQKYLFQIAKPNSNEYEHELISASEYAERFYKGASEEIELQFVKDAHVFRIYRKQPIEIEITSKTYNDVKVSDEEFKKAWNYYTSGIHNYDGQENNEVSYSPYSMDSLLNSPEFQNEMKALETDTSNDYKALSQKTVRAFKQMLSHTNSMYNELAVMIYEKEKYEQVLIASQNGRKVEPNPLNFLLVAGGILPQIDILSVKQASVSKDNKVWGFYGQRKFNLVKVNGKDEKELFMDFYRIYTMNEAFIYQITLTYISNSGTPRSTWDELVSSLQSLKIVN